MGTREEQRVRTRWAILEAAAEEFEAHGYGATSYASIAARAGVAKSLVSYHFASKGDLVHGMFESFRVEVETSTPVDTIAPLDELVRSTVWAAAEERTNPVARAALRLQRESASIGVELPPPYQGWIDRCALAMTHAIEVGHVPQDLDVPFESHMIVAQYVGLRDLAGAFDGYDRLMERGVIGTLDRITAMGATADALRAATVQAIVSMRAAGEPGVARVEARLQRPTAPAPA